MTFKLLLVLLLAGHQIELEDARRFESQAKCNEALAEFVNLRMNHPYAVTCVQRHDA
jgi:hypothetical protein